MAAYYHNGRSDSGFICGVDAKKNYQKNIKQTFFFQGSLISSKIVVTAAHCVHEKAMTLKKKAEDALFYLGKYFIDTLANEQNFIVSAVNQFEVHPQWKSYDEKYDADIAIAILTKTVQFNKFVQPICLWTATTNYEDLIGRSGVIAGWGKTETSAITSPELRWTEISVVSFQSCILSNTKFSLFVSGRTFCAGNRIDGNGPCNGDSG